MAHDLDAQALALTALGRGNRKPCDALSTIKALMSAGQDCTFGIWTDSIGDEHGDGVTTLREWPALLADRFASAYPAYKVQIFYWDYTTSTISYYAAPVAVSAGQGETPPTLTIRNFSVPAAPTLYGLGSLFQAALVAPAFDALLISHGNNHVSSIAANALPVAMGEIIAAIEQFKLYKPGVPIDLVLENPRRDDDYMALVNTAWRKAAQFRDTGLIDVYAAFMAAGRPASLFQATGNQANDNVHPSQAGSTLYCDVIWAAYQAAETRTVASRPSLLMPGPADANLLVNGSFTQWSDGATAPYHWTIGGAGSMTATKDTGTWCDARQPYSLKLLGSGGAGCIYQTIPTALRAKLFGQRITFAAKRYLSNTGTSSVGAIQINVTAPSIGGATLYRSRSYTTRLDGWSWHVLAGVPVPADCTDLTVLLYHDIASTPSAYPVYFDQVSLTAGCLPGGVR